MSGNEKSNRLFLAGVSLMTLLVLFYGADFVSLWAVESPLSLGALDLLDGAPLVAADGLPFLGKILAAGGLSTTGLGEWGLRFPALLGLVFGLFAFYRWGRMVFGGQVALGATLLAAASFPMLLIGKVGTADAWLFALQVTLLPLSIIQIKQPKYWRLALLVTLSLLMGLFSPLAAVVYLGIFHGLLALWHSGGKRLGIVPLIAIPGIILLKYLCLLEWVPQGFLFSYENALATFFILTLFGAFSSWGFLPAALLHSIKRIRTKEELSIISISVILAGIVSVSLAGHFFILFIISKQISDYSTKNYPYKNWVKTGLILQVVLSFFLGAALMMYGYAWFGGSGFRSGLLFGSALWISGVVTVISLYSDSQRFLRSAIVLGGLLSLYALWGQVLPLWESERNTPKDLANTVLNEAGKVEGVQIVYIDELRGDKEFVFYTKTILEKYDCFPKSNHFQSDSTRIISILERDSSMSNVQIKAGVKGRDYPWLPYEDYILITE